jgi:hypothetical protein
MTAPQWLMTRTIPAMNKSAALIDAGFYRPSGDIGRKMKN